MRGCAEKFPNMQIRCLYFSGYFELLQDLLTYDMEIILHPDLYQNFTNYTNKIQIEQVPHYFTTTQLNQLTHRYNAMRQDVQHNYKPSIHSHNHFHNCEFSMNDLLNKLKNRKTTLVTPHHQTLHHSSY